MKDLINEYGSSIVGATGSVLFLAMTGKFLYSSTGILTKLLENWGGFP